MQKDSLRVFGLLLLSCSFSVQSFNPAKAVHDSIFSHYERGLRPICSNVDRVNATLGLALRQLIDLDEPDQIIKLNVWIRLTWNDCLLQWDPAQYNDTTSITVPYKKLWVPDLTLYDSMTTSFNGIDVYNPTVYSDGTVYYNFPTVLEVLCPVDVTNFPFDEQICTLMFGSWSYNGLALDFSLPEKPVFFSAMKDNVEWDISDVTSKRNVVFYECCPEPYPDVTFYVHLKRKPAFYVTNIIIPSLMITVLVVLGFILPVDSGEKVSLEVTVMLAMSVFQLLVADKLPPSADSTPWIAIFFNFILGLSGISCVLQVIVINIYYRPELKPPDWMIKIVIRPACYITCVTLPGHQSGCCINRKEVNSNYVVNDVKTGASEERHGEIWKCFSNAVDRLSLAMFSITLTTGCVFIFQNIIGH